MQDKVKLGSSDLFMLFATLFWAINFSFIKIALREFNPLGFNGIRLAFASFLLILFLLVSRENLSLIRSDIWKVFVLGIVGNTVFQILFIHGLNWTTASNTAIVMAMTPLFVALLSSALKQEKIHWIAWLGIVVSFIGFYLVISKQSGFFQFSWQGIRGDLMIFFGNLCWALYTVFSKPLLTRISPLKLTAITMTIGAVFYLPFCMRDIVDLHPEEISLKAWAALLYSGLFALAICYVIWYSSVKRVGNTKTAVYSYIVPVFAVIFAYIFISEKITLLQAIGALIIFVGVYFTRSGYMHFMKRKDQ